MTRFQALRGMPDMLPSDTPAWAQLEQVWRGIVDAYGYQEIRLPLLESSALFEHSIGNATDIVEKEMFSLQTKDGESIALRPEGTASCVRAGIEHGLLYHQIQRLWYMGPMFRYERPQKGRYRQFHQIGVEAFGLEGPDIEVEQLLMLTRFWKVLRLESALCLEVNSLGSWEARQRYRQVLVDYFGAYAHSLDADSQRRLGTNPLRILDSKNPAMADLIAGAPQAQDYWDAASAAHFESLLGHLDAVGIPYRQNPRLVRGLDYYNRTVYEWTSDQLGAQSAVCGGGRYDKLVAHLGGQASPAVGFSIGVEHVLLLLQTLGLGVMGVAKPDIYVVHSPETLNEAFLVAEWLRDVNSAYAIVVHAGPGPLKQQFKKADQSGASLALVVDADTASLGSYGLKFLREAADPIRVDRGSLLNILSTKIGK